MAFYGSENTIPGTYASAAAAAADAKLARGLLRAVRDRLVSLSSTDNEKAEESAQVDEGEGAIDEGMRARTEAARRYRRARRTAWSAAEATLDDFRVAAKRAAAVQVQIPLSMGQNISRGGGSKGFSSRGAVLLNVLSAQRLWRACLSQGQRGGRVRGPQGEAPLAAGVMLTSSLLQLTALTDGTTLRGLGVESRGHLPVKRRRQGEQQTRGVMRSETGVISHRETRFL